MNWKTRLDNLNRSMEQVTSAVAGNTYTLNVDSLSIEEQIEVLLWFKEGGLWDTWRPSGSDEAKDVCFHHLLKKGFVELNVGYSYYNGKTGEGRVEANFTSKDKSRLEREDGSLLCYALLVFPHEHKSLEALAPHIKTVNSRVVSALLKFQ